MNDDLFDVFLWEIPRERLAPILEPYRLQGDQATVLLQALALWQADWLKAGPPAPGTYEAMSAAAFIEESRRFACRGHILSLKVWHTSGYLRFRVPVGFGLQEDYHHLEMLARCYHEQDSQPHRDLQSGVDCYHSKTGYPTDIGDAVTPESIAAAVTRMRSGELSPVQVRILRLANEVGCLGIQFDNLLAVA